MSWTSGYVAEIDYTYGYYRELSPSALDLALLSAGQSTRPLCAPRYLELGFGQGLSLNIHAAANGGEYWGTDFNPSHAAGAEAMARASGAPLTILDSSFEELAARSDLPSFDVIALHGIWSWVSDANRAHITEIIRKRLAPGGIVYISYNCTPGWSAAMPLRHLLTLHAEMAESAAQGIAGRIDGALAFAQRMIEADALFFKANPAVVERLKKISTQNRSYLAHEYFNADWDPMPFSDVARQLDDAKLTFAASAAILDHIEWLNLGKSAQELLKNTKHPVLRESLRDYLMNQQFRRDIFIKGARPLGPLERFNMLRELRPILLSDPKDISMEIQTPLGTAKLQEDVYKPLIAALERATEKCGADGDFWETSSLGHIEQQLSKGQKKIAMPQLAQAFLVLAANGHLSIAQSPEVQEAARPRCDALNRWIVSGAKDSGAISFLASPVTGQGISVDRFEQMMLESARNGAKQSEEIGRSVAASLEISGQRIVKDGKTLESADAMREELTARAKAFLETRLPALQRLGVIP